VRVLERVQSHPRRHFRAAGEDVAPVPVELAEPAVLNRVLGSVRQSAVLGMDGGEQLAALGGSTDRAVW
jgi:hypothetical protein